MKQIAWLNSSRALAIFAVVTLHVSAILLSEKNTASLEWWAGNLINSSVRWCVPVFIMISGALLLEDNQAAKITAFYKNRLKKIMVPLIFWSIFFIVWSLLKLNIKEGNISNYNILSRLITGTPYYHMWFIYMILPLYILTPFLQKVILKSSKQELNLLIAFSFIVSILYNIDDAFSDHSSSIFLTKFLSFIPYFLIGYNIKRSTETPPKQVLWIVFLASIIVTSLGYYYGSINDNRLISLYFYDYLSVSVLAMSLSFFYILKEWKLSVFLEKKIAKLSLLSLGIYLVHPVIIDIIRFFKIGPDTFNPIISLPIITITVFAVSLSTCLIIRKMPVIKKII